VVNPVDKTLTAHLRAFQRPSRREVDLPRTAATSTATNGRTRGVANKGRTPRGKSPNHVRALSRSRSPAQRRPARGSRPTSTGDRSDHRGTQRREANDATPRLSDMERALIATMRAFSSGSTHT